MLLYPVMEKKCKKEGGRECDVVGALGLAGWDVWNVRRGGRGGLGG